MDPTVRQLRAFLHVAQTGQFTLAAQKMHITQSALSTLIKELENSLNVRLFDRHTRMVELTEAGARFYGEADKTLGTLDNAIAEMHELASLRTGRVRIVASTVISSGLLSKTFKKFKEAHPNMQFVLHDIAEEDIMRTVLSGNVDFGIGTSNELEHGLDEDWLFDDRFIALFQHDHPLARRDEVSWSDLQGLPFIALAAKSPIRRLIDKALADHGLDLNIVNEVSFATTVLSLVSAGLGVSVLPMNNHPSLPAFNLHACRLVDPIITRKISIFTPSHRSLSPGAAAFAEFLHAYIKGNGEGLG